MFLKKSAFIVLGALIALGAILGLCCGGAFNSVSATVQKTIVIDAGHGGIDAGVLGVNTSVKESDINLAIAKQLKGYFANAGFNVVMTRTNNGGLYGFSTKGFKMRDMKKRKEIIETCDADMVISIHQNTCPLPSRRGGTVFFDKNSESGKDLAQNIQTQINAIYDGVKPNEALVGDYYMLKCTQNPSVIVECGFLSNADDESLLITEAFQKSVAYAIFKGAVSYYT